MFSQFNIFKWLRQLRLYVVADPTDNSITFSKQLYKRLHLMELTDAPYAYVFLVKGEYAFCINPKDVPNEKPKDGYYNEHLPKIQYNTKTKTIGFESILPTVNRIFYDYGLPFDRPVKLTVSPRKRKTEQGTTEEYFVINCPAVYE